MARRGSAAGLRLARRVAIGLLGGSLVLLGLLLVLTPGPALLVIPAGLGVLALEFDTPRRLRDRLQERLRRWRARGRPRRNSRRRIEGTR